MNSDVTEAQGGDERRRALEISAHRERPPLEIPGYRPVKYLGMGAYGEVWVAEEENTQRRVAIKFYTHRGGLDWSLLSREVEKLAFLFADRYVVQLLNVGWQADPPYYIMEYMERGSLAERIEQGPLPVAEAVDLFRYVAIGLVHAHGKGVLHCDLKPANILLDQDGKPRLADFGQSRLSHDQTPALGTLFYMAPEQASLTEAPNARWDVYALGAVLYCMLTGRPPHWSEDSVRLLQATDDLKKRLSLYRRMIRRDPMPLVHRKVRGVDRQLAEIIDRALAPAPENRYPNVQSVLGALDARDKRRSRRPVMLLGAIGPVLLLAVVTWFAWQGFGAAVSRTDHALTARSLQTNEFLANNLARLAGFELDRRLQRISFLARAPDLREALLEASKPDSEMSRLIDQLDALEKKEANPKRPSPQYKQLRAAFQNHEQRKRLQKTFTERVTRHPLKTDATIGNYDYFLNDARGIQVARQPEQSIIGRNYAWRTYFTGRSDDMKPTERPEPGEHITEAHISAPYRSQATNEWIVAISAPIYDRTSDSSDVEKDKPKFLGVVALMVPVGDFIRFEGESASQFATLIDWRDSKRHGLVLQHPKLEDLLKKYPKVSEKNLPEFTVQKLEEKPDHPGRLVDYHDPVVDKPGAPRRWLAQMASIPIDGRKPGPDKHFVVVVQEDYRNSIGATLARLKQNLVDNGIIALAIIVIVMIGLWTLAIRMFRGETAEQIEQTETSPMDSTTGSVSPSPTPSATPMATPTERGIRG